MSQEALRNLKASFNADIEALQAPALAEIWEKALEVHGSVADLAVSWLRRPDFNSQERPLDIALRGSEGVRAVLQKIEEFKYISTG